MNPFDHIERVSASNEHYPLIALLAALVGGVLSTSTCPCTLRAGVGVVGYVGSRTEDAPEGRRRRRGVLLSVAFFLTIVLSLLALGIAASCRSVVLALEFGICGWCSVFSRAAGLALT